MEKDATLLDTIVKSLADRPEAVQITRSTDDMGVLLTLQVAAEDMGKVIGKAGGMAKAIRMVLRGHGMKHNARVNVKILEPIAV